MTMSRSMDATTQADRETAVTDDVIASFLDARSDRFRAVMESLVRHLHEFAREVRLTESEWEMAIKFLTRVGHITDETRQEFILLSDVLGLSMLAVGINHPSSEAITESTVFGPFFIDGAPEVPLGGDIAQGASGPPCWIEGTVTDVDGAPISGARVDVWEADERGLYDVQYEGRVMAARGHLFTNDDGEYRFWSVKPAPYPIPHDGPVGELLEAAGRSPMRPAHIHFRVQDPNHRTLITHIFVAGSEHLRDDAVFGVKEDLIVDFEERPPGLGPEGRILQEPWYRARFDIVLG